MYYKMSEYDEELIDFLSNETGVDYEIIGNMFPMESFIPLLKDLKYELEKYKEKYENLKENSRPITNKELYD